MQRGGLKARTEGPLISDLQLIASKADMYSISGPQTCDNAIVIIDDWRSRDIDPADAIREVRYR